MGHAYLVIEIPKLAWDFVQELKPIFKHMSARDRSVYIFAHSIAVMADVASLYEKGRVIYAESERKSGYYSLDEFKKAFKESLIFGGRIRVRDEGSIRDELEKLRIFFGLDTREEAAQIALLIACEFGTVIKECGFLYHGTKGGIYSTDNVFLPELLQYIRSSVLH